MASTTMVPQRSTSGPQLTCISASSDGSVWGVGPNGSVQQYVQSGPAWTAVPGQMAVISAAADGTVLGINDRGGLYRYVASDSAWTSM